MGHGVVYQCSECEYKSEANFGFGMMFPMTYAMTIKEMKEGKFGKEAKRFIEEHPEGAVNCDLVVKRCEFCGALRNEKDLSMYLPKDPDKTVRLSGEKARWSVAFPGWGIEYFTPYDLEDSFVLYKKHADSCGKCHHRTFRVFSESELQEAIEAGDVCCPECGGKLVPVGDIMWD